MERLTLDLRRCREGSEMLESKMETLRKEKEISESRAHQHELDRVVKETSIAELQRQVEEQHKLHENAVDRLTQLDQKLNNLTETNRTLQDKLKEHMLRSEVTESRMSTQLQEIETLRMDREELSKCKSSLERLESVNRRIERERERESSEREKEKDEYSKISKETEEKKKMLATAEEERRILVERLQTKEKVLAKARQ